METKWYHRVKWTSRPVSDLDLLVSIENGRNPVCDVYETAGQDVADLIAAAPETATQRDELLEAFKHADANDWDFLLSLLNKSVRHSEDAETRFWIDSLKKARSAIARATGASS